MDSISFNGREGPVSPKDVTREDIVARLRDLRERGYTDGMLRTELLGVTDMNPPPTGLDLARAVNEALSTPSFSDDHMLFDLTDADGQRQLVIMYRNWLVRFVNSAGENCGIDDQPLGRTFIVGNEFEETDDNSPIQSFMLSLAQAVPFRLSPRA